MKEFFLRRCAVLLAFALAACASIGGGERAATGPEVTRFHLGQPVARAQIAVEPFDPADANAPEFRSYAAAVARELTRLGWTVVNTLGQSEQVALIDVEQGTRGALQTGRVGVGAAAAAADAAAAAGTVATRLEVRIKRRSDGTVFWEGRSMMDTSGGAAPAQRSAIVDNLAAALFRDFPGESGRTIRAR